MKKVITAVIDAGSSGTRLFLYEVQPGRYPVVMKLAEVEHSVMPNGDREDGINNFVHPLAPHLEEEVIPLIIHPLLNSIRPRLSELGIDTGEVEVHLFATAGMRYSERMFGSDAIARFYDRIRHGINQARFVAGQIRTIDGQTEEGVWTWINLNDLERDVFRTDTPPLGVIEIGGSSAQFSFPVEPHSANKENIYMVAINGRQFDLYCKSYMGLGQDDARKSMRIKLGEASSCCFPSGFSSELDLGDVLDGVGQYHLSHDGDYQFERCDSIYEQIIEEKIQNNPLPKVESVNVEFVGIDAVYHSTKYWNIEHDPMRLAAMLIDRSLQAKHFPGIEANEFVQAQAANATYVRALLFGTRGLFTCCPERMIRALPSKTDEEGTRLTWTRGYLLQKFAN